MHEVVFVEDMARYDLHLHLGLGTIIEKFSLQGVPQTRFNPVFDEPLAVELQERDANEVWSTSRRCGRSCNGASWSGTAAAPWR